uniref:Uncharacterized protein AlNc14C21G2207 n=1 Tax=Albugo laibachii Nc14 TaxID=890382 RepID=F0W5P2_9STRA|nr:conserved hypothetical protein [Albugo laibachii Nc14]|eukprot:CCA16433.1 conserved hypothetical protein [Albugo laibachii Nc14]
MPKDRSIQGHVHLDCSGSTSRFPMSPQKITSPNYESSQLFVDSDKSILDTDSNGFMLTKTANEPKAFSDLEDVWNMSHNHLRSFNDSPHELASSLGSAITSSSAPSSSNSASTCLSSICLNTSGGESESCCQNSYNTSISLSRPSFDLASSNPGKKSATAFPLACSFEAFSHHFHLPLKVAAEKFGVRATAFKKRCRAIGIRHWPYRKVRSLKRSIQELGRCKEEGTINEKQKHQFQNFKIQLEKLLSPETYGIDRHKRMVRFQFNDDDDTIDSGDEVASNNSPNVHATFTDCSITSIKLNDAKMSRAIARSGRRGKTSVSSCGLNKTDAMSSATDTNPMASVSVRFTHGNEFGFESYDNLFGDFKRESHLGFDDFTGSDYTSGQCFIDPSISAHEDLFLPSMRSPTGCGHSNQFPSSSAPSTLAPPYSTGNPVYTNLSPLPASASIVMSPSVPSMTFASSQHTTPTNNTTSTSASVSDHIFDDDDMFLQLSPDCGCIV